MRDDDVNIPDRRSVTQAAPRLRWLKETVIGSLFYALYSAIRNRFGSFHLAASGVPLAPFRHALQVVRFERVLGLYRERDVQQLFLGHHRFLQF